MKIEDAFAIVLAAFFVLIVLVSGLVFYFLRLKKRMDLFFRKGSEDLEKVLANQLKESEKQGKDIKKIFAKIKELTENSQKSFQKIGLVRFNPFKNGGGDQSFSIALLDLKNNGFVITSIYGRDGNRIYAKPVDKGQSEYSLSGEEREAIKKAIGF